MSEKKCRNFNFISFDAIVTANYGYAFSFDSVETHISSQCTVRTHCANRVSRLFLFAQVFLYVSFINYVSSARTELDTFRNCEKTHTNNQTIDFSISQAVYVPEFGAKKKINAN